MSKTITILTAGVFQDTTINSNIADADWTNTHVDIFYLDKETGESRKLNLLEYPIVNIVVSYTSK